MMGLTEPFKESRERKVIENSQFKKLLEELLLSLWKKAKLGDSWYIEYTVKDETEPRYQVLTPKIEDK
jgi:hypothetical protein